MSYLQYYGLDQEPFSNAPVSRFYFSSVQHEQAILRLQRIASQMKGLAVLVGDIGAGKTTLARKMLDSLPESEYEAALLVIIHSGITANWLLKRIAQQLGVQKPAQDKLQLLSQLYRRLLQIAESGKKAIVLIDEAQMLQTRELMEEFRGMLNLELPEKKLITFVFFGLPEIEKNLKLDPPLLQRVALRFRLDGLDFASCDNYIEHRLKLSGASEAIFDAGAKEAIFHYSGGVPRLVNTISDNALFEGFILKAKPITAEVIDNIAVDLGLAESNKSQLRLVNAARPKEDGELSLDISSQEVVVEEVVPQQEAKSEAQQFERQDDGQSEDIDSILAGLEEKV